MSSDWRGTARFKSRHPSGLTYSYPCCFIPILPDFRAFFAGFTDALGFFGLSSGFRGTLSSMMNCFPHFGHVRWLNLIASITVARIRRAAQCGQLIGISVSGNLMVRLAPGNGRLLFQIRRRQDSTRVIRRLGVTCNHEPLAHDLTRSIHGRSPHRSVNHPSVEERPSKSGSP